MVAVLDSIQLEVDGNVTRHRRQHNAVILARTVKSFLVVLAVLLMTTLERGQVTETRQ